MDSEDFDYLCWGLEHDYSDASVKKGIFLLDFFKGKDKKVMSGIKNALDHDKQISGSDRWEMFIATANKNINEYGECSSYYDRWGGSDGCSGDGCFEYTDEESRSFEIDDFIALTENSSECDELKFDLSLIHI